MQITAKFNVFNLKKKEVQNENHFVDPDGKVYRLLNGIICECTDPMLVLLQIDKTAAGGIPLYIGDVVLILERSLKAPMEPTKHKLTTISDAKTLNNYCKTLAESEVSYVKIGCYFIDSSYELDRKEQEYLRNHGIGEIRTMQTMQTMGRTKSI